MRGEFIAVWPEAWREIWQPPIDQPVEGSDEGLLADIFCELFRDLSKALRMPTESAAVNLLLQDAIALRELFDSSAQGADRDLAHELVREAFDNSGAEDAATPEQRRVLLEAALSELLRQSAGELLNVQLEQHARDATRVGAAWQRVIERRGGANLTRSCRVRRDRCRKRRRR